MSNWMMITLVGEDQSGIVAQVTEALFQSGMTLGEASMIRLGGNFSIMMMASGGTQSQLAVALKPVVDSLQLRMHIDDMQGGLHQHRVPNYQVRVVGADRAGIVAQVTGALAESGFNILELESDVAGGEDNPVYIMNIQGYSETAYETIQAALDGIGGGDIDVSVSTIDTLIG